jgi:hypothetical protein
LFYLLPSAWPKLILRMGYCRSDPFNSANQQNCSYGYDGMTRVSSVGCGNVWQRTFSYDPFGNITKTGSSSRTPTYTNSKNQYLSGWNGVTYWSGPRI